MPPGSAPVTGGDATRRLSGLGLAGLGVGGSTFVPGTLRALRRGRLGVGTLMTIAAVGVVLLGQYGVTRLAVEPFL